MNLVRLCLTASVIGLSLVSLNSCAESDINYAETNDLKTNDAKSAASILYLLGYDIPKSQREQVVVQDIETLKKYLNRRAAIKDIDTLFEGEPSKYRRDDYDSVQLSSLTLCDFKGSVRCLDSVNNNPTPYRQSLEKLSLVMKDIDILRQHSDHELVSIVPDKLRSSYEITANYQYLLKPLTTQSVLAYYDDPRVGLTTVCDNIGFGKKLIQSKDSLIQTFIGVGLINNNLDLLEHATEPLPQSCVKVLQPLASKDIAICSLVNGEALKLKNLLISMDEVPILFSHDASISMIDEDTQLFCNAEWTNEIRNDEMTSYPINNIKIPVLFNRTGSDIVNLAKIDYSNYQNQLLDLNAHLRLWQAAIDPKCQTAVNNPKILDSLFIEAYSDDNTPLVDYLNTLLNDLSRVRALNIDNQKQFSITAYDQSDYIAEKSKVDTLKDLSYISVSCRTVQ